MGGLGVATMAGDAALTTGAAGMSDLTEGMEQGPAELPLAAEVISEPDPIAAAAQVIEQLKAKRAALVDRINVNRSTSAEIAFAAFTDGGKPKKNLDDLNIEAFALERDLLNLDSAIAEAE